jgi:hypothetical protein
MINFLTNFASIQEIFLEINSLQLKTIFFNMY